MRTAVIGAVFLALLLGATGSAALAGQMYWVWYNIDSGSIVRANENGTGVESIFGCTFCSLGPLAIDDGAGKVWFGFFDDGGTVSRMNLDGSNVEQIVALAGGWFTTGLALDLVGGKLYWSTSQTIEQANLDGTGVVTLLSGLSDAEGLSIDTAGGKMYWTEEPARLRRANLDGSAPEELVVGSGSFAETALHVASGKVYWLEDSSPPELWRANLDGSDPETLPPFLWSGTGLAIDADTESIFISDWNGTGSFPGGGRIVRTNLDGGHSIVVVGDLPVTPSMIALAGTFHDVPAATEWGIAVAALVLLGISSLVLVRRMRPAGR